MANGIYKALSGSAAQLRKLDVLANNLANAGTPGYKADGVAFSEVLDQKLQTGTEFIDTPKTGVYLGQGGLRETGNPLDLALNGDGFFVVQTEQGDRLTRNGRLTIGHDGTLRTASGQVVLGESGPISIPPATGQRTAPLTVDGAGRIFQGNLELGQLRQVKAEASALRKVGDNMFGTDADVATLPNSNAEIVQGHIEEANVNPVASMTQIIDVQRSFEALQQVVRTYKDIDGQSVRRMR